jgi:RNA polymerase sigma factor (sigma-70 family)
MTNLGGAPLSKQVKSAEKFWRDRARELNAHLQQLAALEWPARHMELVMRRAEHERERWRQDLLSQFGVDIQNTSLAEQGEIRELDTPNYDAFIITFVNALFWDQTHSAVQREFAEATEDGMVDRPRRVLRTYLGCWQLLEPILMGCITEYSSDDGWRTSALVALGGWTSSVTSERVKSTMRAGLDGNELLNRLPAATLLAWDELRRSDELRLDTLRSRTQKQIRGEGQPRKNVRQSDGTYEKTPVTQLSALGMGCIPGDIDVQFELREEAEQAMRGLTPREAEVFRLHLEGYRDAEIAERLNVKPGTVAATLHHARTKLSKRQSS